MISCHALLGALLLSASGETVLLDFSAAWCGPCRQMEPTIAQLAAAGHPVRQIDIDRQPELAQRFRVDGVPCFVMLVDGREVGRKVGRTSRGELEQLLALASASTINGSGSESLTGPATFAPAESPLPASTVSPALSDRAGILPKQISEPLQRMTAGIRQAISAPANTVAPEPEAIERAMHASVRIRILDGSGKSTGSGTIVDQRSGEALVVTCAHIFRESKGQGAIEVDVFGKSGQKTYPGKVVSYDLKSDIGLLRFLPSGPLVTASLASQVTPLHKGDTVFSVGCDHGAEPSSRVSRLTSINKYVGAHNVQVAGQPVQGRSGGGLFNAQGELIGVCNAADPKDDEGLYVSLKVIHGELARVGLDQVLNRPAELAAHPPQMPTLPPNGFAGPTDRLQRPLGQSPDPQSPPAAVSVSLTSAEASMLHEVREKAGSAEVICIVKPREGAARAEVVAIERASPDLLTQLQRNRAVTQPTNALLPTARTSVIPQIRALANP